MDASEKIERMQELIALRVVPDLRRVQRTANALVVWSIIIMLMVGAGLVLSMFLVWVTFAEGFSR